MTDFKDRERGEEAKYVFDEENAFKIAARRNRLLGEWAAELMNLTDEEIALLPDLVLTRIVLGTLLVEFQARHAPPHRMDEIAGELPDLRANML